MKKRRGELIHGLWIPKKLIKVFWISLAVITSIELISFSIPANYCFTENKLYSDKEYIRIVLNELMFQGAIELHPWDDTVTKYLEHHKNCCSVFRNKTLFDGANVVSITYKLSYKNRIDTNLSNYHRLTAITSCGETSDYTGEFEKASE